MYLLYSSYVPHQRVKMDALTWHTSPLHLAHHTTRDDVEEDRGATGPCQYPTTSLPNHPPTTPSHVTPQQ